MSDVGDWAIGAGVPIVDIAAERHADVLVDRVRDGNFALPTSASPCADPVLSRIAFQARTPVTASGLPARPRVYLAHASEDKDVVRLIARHLIGSGIDVWFDEWEIQPGDSLRQKMEHGLATMTHFVVVLTPISITKPWVAREIDVGFVGLVGGANRMIPLRVGVEIADLPPFLATLLCERFDPLSKADGDALVARLYGVSRKPPLGPAPEFMRTPPADLAAWSPAAVEIGRYLVTTSQHAMPQDPIVSVEQLVAATGMAQVEIRIAILDLLDAGFLWEGGIPGHVAAEGPLFVDFDEVFMPFSPAADARVVANRMVSTAKNLMETQTLAVELGWEPRRMNSAVCYLQQAGVISTRRALASAPWRVVHLLSTDRTLRFARLHS
ncbi:toll/interleukin-1 receptor domain-containing protein [Glacieibacterium megasporae]|uniref:toll/interleukin-1 receptor domain-containing protein n=1 Tax=Glacieibacterium megasporae TaxID=2835787 RepID=UPI001C1E445E|nr:toll/interleukin-1 receptor domain-containing protein [Polymorphobacter megasporae]UAJ11054.1 toll/interleukin-1 receptor domain-containing protein [Polymorphobacter megasporae]